MSFNLSQLGDLTALSDDDDFEIGGNKSYNKISVSSNQNDNSISQKKAKRKKKKKSKSRLEMLNKKVCDSYSEAMDTDETLLKQAQSIQDKLNQAANDSDSLFSLDGGMVKGNGENNEHLDDSDDSSISPAQPEPRVKTDKGVDRHIEHSLLESESSIITSSPKTKVKKIRKHNPECDISSEQPMVLPSKKRKRDSCVKTTHPVNSQADINIAEDVDSFYLSHQPSSSAKKTKEKARRTHQMSGQSDSDIAEDVDNFFLSGQISKSKRKTKEKPGKKTHQIGSQSDSDPVEDVDNFFLSQQPPKSIKKTKDRAAATIGVINRNLEASPECLESDRNKDDDSEVPFKQMRYKAGPELKEVVFDSDELYLEDLGPDDQLWLLRVPPSYRTKNLDGKPVALGGKCQMKTRIGKGAKQFCWEIKADVNKKMKKSSMTCLLPSKKDKKLHVAGPLNGEISVIKSYCMKPHVIPPAVEKLVPIPEGLKLRNIAFGADNPSTSRRSSTIKEDACNDDEAELKPKKKKKKKRKHSMQDESSLTASNDEVEHKKKKKKKKHINDEDSI